MSLTAAAPGARLRAMADPTRVYYAAMKCESIEEAREYIKTNHPNNSFWSVLAVHGQPKLSLDGETPLNPAVRALKRAT